jgi:hypothetical protein
MKLVQDATRSKRPIPTADEQDLRDQSERIQQEQEVIDRLNLLILAKETDPHYRAVLENSKARIEELKTKIVALPSKAEISALLIRAEMTGQYNERLVLTREIISDKTQIVQKENWIRQALSRLKDLTQKLGKERNAGS